ncbi:MAG TPA: recombination protein RecR [Alphaproteobacteria bacterium]|nr:recombination protein RecR [Alphaproteobacteria bacterium]
MRENEIETLIRLFSRLPGFGRRSARRAVLHLIKKKETQLIPLAAAMRDVIDHVETCPVCGNLDTQTPCAVCRDEKRDAGAICVVQDVADLWAIERSGAFRGRYHVLGGLLSAIEGTGPDELRLPALERRIRDSGVTELILALPATVDGQTTGHYIAERFKDLNVRISSLAQGIPVGGELDYLDDGTIQTALKSRR